MRDTLLLTTANVCHHAPALRDPAVQSMAQMKAYAHSDCPLIDACTSGQLLGPQRRNCIPRMAQDVASYSLAPGATVGSEMTEFRRAPLFSGLGFIDPYASPDQDDLITDKDAICSQVEAWAYTLLAVSQFSFEDQIGQAHCGDHDSYNEGCSGCSTVRLKFIDATDIVYPDGIAKRVPRNQCRCPILRVGDFCPVHGG